MHAVLGGGDNVSKLALHEKAESEQECEPRDTNTSALVKLASLLSHDYQMSRQKQH